MKYVEPVNNTELIISVVPEDRLIIPKIQRTLSDKHVEKLVESINKVGFVEPLTVIPSEEEEGKYEIINGQHRYMAGKKLGMSEFPVIILPKNLKEYIIFLNTEKVPNIRDKAHQAIEIFRSYQNSNPNMEESELFKFIEKAYYITVGFILEEKQDQYFPATAFERFLDRFDDFLDLPLSKAYNERMRRADVMLELKRVLNKRYSELNLTNPQLKNALVNKAMQMQWGKTRKISTDFYQAAEIIKENLERVELGNTSNVEADIEF